jgi:hypothetical protein
MISLVNLAGRWRRLPCGLAAAVLLAGCALPRRTAQEVGASPWAAQSGQQHGSPAAAAWLHKTFPGKEPTRFAYERIEGRDAVSVHANSSASMLRQTVRIEPQDLGRVRFSWKVPELIAQADVSLREKDDAAVRIVLAFEGDRSRFTARDSALSELARLVTGEEMPYATLMYVWSKTHQAGSVIHNARTDRIRKIVVETGPQRLNQWLDYERDIAADFERAFGEKPGALVGVGVMSDSDNTRSRARAWYGPLQLVAATP